MPLDTSELEVSERDGVLEEVEEEEEVGACLSCVVCTKYIPVQLYYHCTLHRQQICVHCVLSVYSAPCTDCVLSCTLHRVLICAHGVHISVYCVLSVYTTSCTDPVILYLLDPIFKTGSVEPEPVKIRPDPHHWCTQIILSVCDC